jgi:hypothetical protein
MINLVLIVFVSFFPGVSWAGHLGGAIAGLFIGLWLNYFQFQPGWRRSLQWVGVVLIPVVSVGLLVRTMQTGSQWLKIRRILDREQMSIRTDNETREFEERYGPRIQSSLKQANAKLKETRLEDLLDQGPTRRDGTAAKNAVAGLSTIIDSLDRAAEEVRQAGPYSTPVVEEARKAALKAIEARIAYLEIAKQCLEKGKSWTDEEEAKLQQQKEEMRRADQEWRALLR